MNNQLCPICEQTDYVKVHSFMDYRVEICGECGHGITLPRLAPGELDRLYDEEYFTDQYEACLPGEKELQRKKRQEDHRIKVVKKQIAHGKVLDVGCGLGFFLYACKDRYTPYGFDVSSSNKAYIEQQLGIELFTDEREVQEFTEQQGPFDAVTFWHSLEHFIEPTATLEHFCSLLHDDGVVVIDVPVHDSIDCSMNERKWEGWQIPYHQHHFSSTSLRQLISNMGLSIVDEHTYRSGHVYQRLKSKWYLRPFARSIAKLFRGGSMVVVCKKNR
ncbi:class I SAM-dependent methyltransferase [Desulfogranum marinum]|uniref:class I SAM-dependent methyltransferase n=1 Tax=Desulfogranum marinum TaxID=453220 RepID=UPI0019631A83|nr:class I SAM-dependent methyltransferase [Desulfogranum marinum]MBM9510926.1 class I SAM-dependent methyltransferase [Desulfogranum marinum]